MSAVTERVQRAVEAGGRLARAPAEARTRALEALAAALVDPAVRARVLEANARDLAAATGLASPLVKRLRLDPAKLETLSDGARQLAARADPLGTVLAHRKLDEGLVLTQESCPLGVLAVVFESRPDALVQIASLALRSGNAVLLKGGREAAESNRALAEVVRGALASAGLPPDAVQLLDDRSEVEALLGLEKGVDLVVARGGKEFVEHVRARSRIPVLAHAEGVCHVFLHRSADPAKAARIVVDSKVSYPAACNALETLLWEPGAESALDASVAALRSAGVELRGDAATRARHPEMKAATDQDWVPSTARSSSRWPGWTTSTPRWPTSRGTVPSTPRPSWRRTARLPSASWRRWTRPACSTTRAPASPTATASASEARWASAPGSCTPVGRWAWTGSSRSGGCSAARAR